MPQYLKQVIAFIIVIAFPICFQQLKIHSTDNGICWTWIKHTPSWQFSSSNKIIISISNQGDNTVSYNIYCKNINKRIFGEIESGVTSHFKLEKKDNSPWLMFLSTSDNDSSLIAAITPIK